MRHPPRQPEKYALESPELEPVSNLKANPEPSKHFEPTVARLQEEAAFQRNGDWFQAEAGVEEVRAALKSIEDRQQGPVESTLETTRAEGFEVQAIPEETIQFAVEQAQPGVMNVEDAHLAAPSGQLPVLVSCEGFLLQPVAGPVDAMLIGVQTFDTTAVPV